MIRDKFLLLEIFFTLYKINVVEVLTNMLNTFKITNACTIAPSKILTLQR